MIDGEFKLARAHLISKNVAGKSSISPIFTQFNKSFRRSVEIIMSRDIYSGNGSSINKFVLVALIRV